MEKMDEIKRYYNTKAKTYDDIFDTLYFKIHAKLDFQIYYQNLATGYSV